MRERLHFLLIFAACAGALLIASIVGQHLDPRVLIPVMLVLSAFALAICAILAVSVRFSVPRQHIFREKKATLYLGGIFIVQETVAAKKIQTLQVWRASLDNVRFCLFCIVCHHIKQGRNAGVFPIYFCVETADAPHIITWARDRHIHVEEKDQLTSSAKLPFFIKK